MAIASYRQQRTVRWDSQKEEETWILEIHNPTDTAITTRIRAHPGFDPLKGKAVPADPMVIPPGESWIGKY
jgi:hypothetical protein